MHEGMIETSDHGNLSNDDNVTKQCTTENLTPMTTHKEYHNFLFYFLLLYQHTNVFYFFTQVPSLNLNTITLPYLPGPKKKR